ncbi:MAG: hypothetical protein F9K48_08375 [Candidatus Brocadia sp.]|nr:MAG: hypothetical protein F9K48_08375 [Candidatus Brocadia sp.]
MKIPGFNAESSLGPTLGLYHGNAIYQRAISAITRSEQLVVPQMMKQFTCRDRRMHHYCELLCWWNDGGMSTNPDGSVTCTIYD